MMEQRRVVLFGDSLLIDTVETGLEGREEVDVVRICPPVADVKQSLDILRPELFIFDWNVPYWQCVGPYIRERPDIPYLFLDVTRGEVVALSSQKYPILTADDLVQLIQAQIAGRNGHGARN
jgi:hypothetical protein